MLEVQNLSSMASSPHALPAEAGVGELITAAFGTIRRQFLLIMSFALIGTICGIIYLRIAPPVYIAQVEILFDRSKTPSVQQQPIFSDAPFDASYFESQIKVLQSEGIALSVIRKLHLIEDSEFVGSSSGPIRFFSPELPKSESDFEQQALGVFLKKIEAKRIGITFVIEVSFRSSHPNRAAQIANAVADTYIADQMESKYEANRRANDWLRNRLEDLRRQTSADEQAVNSYKIENKMVNAGGSLISDQALVDLNRQLGSARAKTSEALARLDRIESVLRMSRPEAPVDGTVSEALNSPIITKLRQDYLEYVNKEAEFSARYGKDHVSVINLHNKIRDILASMSRELRRLAETSRNDYLTAKQRQESVERELTSSVSESQATNEAQVTLRDLESAAQSSRSLQNLFQQRLVESTVQQQAFLFSDAKVITPATAPSQKNSPKTIVTLAVSILGSMILGGGLGFLREEMDRVFRTGKQVESILLTPCVALVPLQKADAKEMQISPDQGFRTMPIGSKTIIYRSAVLNSPLSYFAEAIRTIKLAADLKGKGSDTIFGLTSSLPNEGKTTIAVALAQLAAQAGRQVILVDLDLRNPSLTRMLAPSAKIGIIEVLSGQCSIDEALWIDPATKMALLPAVINALPLIDTSEILASASTRKLFDQLRQNYEFIAVDLPPIFPCVDVRATTHLVDFYFLVVEWGRTKINVVQHALNSASGVHDNLAGVVLNKTKMEYIARYDTSEGAYYCGKDYARYGYME
jgi:polysaccharide biosynthesis transport protein